MPQGHWARDTPRTSSCQPGTLQWLAGAELVQAFKVPEAKRFTNQFCKVCGSRLPRQPAGSDVVVIPAGSLDAAPSMAPQARIFLGSRASWACSSDTLPGFDEMPPL